MCAVSTQESLLCFSEILKASPLQVIRNWNLEFHKVADNFIDGSNGSGVSGAEKGGREGAGVSSTVQTTHGKDGGIESTGNSLPVDTAGHASNPRHKENSHADRDRMHTPASRASKVPGIDREMSRNSSSSSGSGSGSGSCINLVVKPKKNTTASDVGIRVGLESDTEKGKDHKQSDGDNDDISIRVTVESVRLRSRFQCNPNAFPIPFPLGDHSVLTDLRFAYLQMGTSVPFDIVQRLFSALLLSCSLFYYLHCCTLCLLSPPTVYADSLKRLLPLSSSLLYACRGT